MDTHLCTRHLHTHTPAPHTRPPSNKPQRLQGSPAAVTHPLPSTPLPGGGDVPEGTEVFGPILSPAGSRVTSAAPSLPPSCWEFRAGCWARAGARHRHFGPCWENREALLSTAHPPAPTARSPSSVLPGCAAHLITVTGWTPAQLGPRVRSPRGPTGISTSGLLPTQMPGPPTSTSSKSLAKETMERSYWPSTSQTGCSTR